MGHKLVGKTNSGGPPRERPSQLYTSCWGLTPHWRARDVPQRPCTILLDSAGADENPLPASRYPVTPGRIHPGTEEEESTSDGPAWPETRVRQGDASGVCGTPCRPSSPPRHNGMEHPSESVMCSDTQQKNATIRCLI
ncbi:hypothetical protein RUM43_006341 [Polyplax serrata]|uniref:Uncharacterized protein n=1 Tax=Polyplax serrata TaxID=468196 RepID=A0AAN8S5D8_POLSC